MEELYGIIYKATNLINGKIYIGQTTQKLEDRINQHKRKSGRDCKTVFALAIKKYGFENFHWETVDEAFSKEELDDKEKLYIIKFKSFIRVKGHNGYNMTEGGEGVGSANLGRKASRETCIKIGNIHRGKILSVETKAKIRKSREGKYTGKNHPLYGTNLSEISKQKISRTQKKRLKENGHPMQGVKGVENVHSKLVIQLTMDGEFVKSFISMAEASEYLGLSPSSISNCCCEVVKAYKGFIWMLEEDYNNENVKRRVKENKQKWSQRELVQMSLDGEAIATYNSIRDAERALNIGRASAISRVLKGKQKTSNGFKWMYKEDYDKISNAN